MDETLPAPATTPAPVPLDAGAMAGDVFPLHPRVRSLWRWQHALIALPFSLPPTFIAIASDTWLLLPAVALGALLLVRLLDAWRERYVKSFRCVLLPDGLLVRRGVWWRSETFVPRARIQHTEVNQGPLDRRWDMASLSLHTAGTRLEHIVLPGLPRVIAEQLRDTLLDRRPHVDGA